MLSFLHIKYWVYWWGVGSGEGLKEWPLWGHSWFQMVPAGSNGPTTGASWAPQPNWWQLCENVFKKGQKTLNREKRREQKEWEAAVQTPRSGKEEKVVLHGGADIPLQPVEDLCQHGWIFPKDWSPWWTHTGAEEKHGEQGAVGRDTDHNPVTPITPAPLRAETGVGSEGEKLSLEEWWGKVSF